MINASRYRFITPQELLEVMDTDNLKISVVSNNEVYPVCLYDGDGNKYVIQTPSNTIEVLLKALYEIEAGKVVEMLHNPAEELEGIFKRLVKVLENDKLVQRNKITHLTHYTQLLQDLIIEVQTTTERST